MLHTFSVIAYAPENGDFGVAVATGRPTVGSLVPFLSHQGAVATQERVDTDIARAAMRHLECGSGIDEALRSLLAADRHLEVRQVHGVDRDMTFAFTGDAWVAWAGHLERRTYSVAGTMLTGPSVLAAMEAAMEQQAGGDLSRVLLASLVAGQRAGGDERGAVSSALLVASREPRLLHNLRVDHHPDPVGELSRLCDVCREHVEHVPKEYGDEGFRLSNKVRW